MGIVFYCDKEGNDIINQDIYLSIESNNISARNEQRINNFIKLIFFKLFFTKLKNIWEIAVINNKGYLNENDNKIKIENISGEELKSNNIQKKEEEKSKQEILIEKNKNDNANKKKFESNVPSNNGNLTLNSSMNLKSISSNEKDTQFNDNINKNIQSQPPQNSNQETPNPEQLSIIQENPPVIHESNSNSQKNSKKIVKKIKKQISENLTPIPEYPTPAINYDKSKIPGDILFNFNDIPLTDEINKIENELGEFVIEQKELLKYMEQYPYVPKFFSIKYPSGEKYSGYFSPDWEKEVFGIQINNDGSKYVGLFKNGMFDGRGRLILKKGDYYEGEFKENKANGFGKYVNSNGEIYIGNWVNDKQEGEGELILKDGSRYKGHFKNGMKNGKGKIAWNDSSYYEGNFFDNYFDGYGVYMMRNKKNYIGQWKMGQMHGFGIFSCPDGKSYKGYYENDKKHGFGIYSGKNNLRYEGKFKKGRQYGIGRVTNEKGEKQLGLYLKGKRLKCLNEKEFKDDVAKIDEEIKKINDIIENNEFFKKNIGLLTIIQEQYFKPD